MPTWGGILAEIKATPAAQMGRPDFDGVRRKYLALMSAHTGRPVILYASAFLEKPGAPSDALQLTMGDIQGFMETVNGLPRGPVDLIVHSPGGSAEATESIVRYLRTKFTHIRVFVPVAAKSAATMLSLGADEIVMGAHSQLGPIDPQFLLPMSYQNGVAAVPAQSLLQEFERAKAECKDPAMLPAWMPILRMYYPGLLQECQNAQALAEEMVADWLRRYMFHGRRRAKERAADAARWFAQHDNFKSHGRQVTREEARSKGIRIANLEDDQGLQDDVLSVFHATAHTFASIPVVKVIENNLGRAFVRMIGQPLASPVQLPFAPQPAPGQPVPQTPPRQP